MVKEWDERRWRHLDTCDFETIVIAKVPRLKLSSGKTMRVTVPWSETGRFTKLMEGHLIEVLKECKTTSGAARLAKITPGEADGVMRRAVAPGAAAPGRISRYPPSGSTRRLSASTTATPRCSATSSEAAYTRS